MRTYDSYKDSGIEWIGEIPRHWFVTRIKYTKKGSKDSFIDGDWIESKDLSDEGIRYITSGNIGEGKYKEQGNGYISEDTFKELNCKEIFEGDLVISRLFLPVGRSCIIPNLNNRVITCVDNVVLRPKESFNIFYLNYQFNSNRYSEFTELISRGVTLTRISRGMLGNNSIVVPPLYEQEQIVSYLDEKTSLIDEMVEKKNRKIELLKEYRTSLINTVVTKGLNPDVPMKNSGIEWIGEIPRHWELKRLKYVCDLVNEQGIPKEDDIRISPENVQSDTGVCSNYYSEHIGVGNKFINGDILFNKLRVYLKKIILTSYNGFSMGEMIVLRVKSVFNKYLYLTLFHQGLINQLNSMSTGVKLPRVSPELIMNSELPLPPLTEQEEIVTYLDDKTSEIDKTIELENKKIELLKEYRQSLISNVVTGKIKVVSE